MADSCNNTKYLQLGLCLDSGCGKGGDYKICCDNKKDGSVCPHVCSGKNTSGTCGPGCYAPSPGVMVTPRVLPEVLNPNTDTKIKLKLTPLAETGHVIPKVALLLWYKQAVFSKIRSFL